MQIDRLDQRILMALHQDASLSQRDLAERIGLSQNALWRRLKRLEAEGIIQGSRLRIDLFALGLDLTVFAMIRTRRHSMDWAEKFRDHVARIPEVVEMHRIGGDWDYMLKIVTRGMAGYDSVYRRLTTGAELETVTGYFSMETMLQDRLPDLTPPEPSPPARRRK
jgi:Lrp/AsnC family transcriptional regulator